MPNPNGRLLNGDPGAMRAPGALFVLCPVDPDREREREARDRLAVRDGMAFLEACAAAGVRGDILAVNMAVSWWPGALPHAASLHGPCLRAQLALRSAQGLPAPGAVHGTERGAWLTHLWTFGHAVPSSAALGCWVARLLGVGLVATNARLDPDLGSRYGAYHDAWTDCAARGLLDGVRHFGPVSDPEGASFVAGLLPGLEPEDLRQARGAT